MSAKIFVSHSSKDQKLAMTISTALEQRGLACWISSRDIGAGENFQEAIVNAIRGARAMVLVFSRNANDSAEIKKELALASEYRIIVIPVRVEDIVPTGAFKYELATRQWVDLFANWEQAIDRLCEQIRRIDAPAGAAAAPLPPKPPPRRRGLLLGGLLAGAAALVAAGVAAFMLTQRPHVPAAPHLRAAPAVLTREEIIAALVKHDLFDAQRNPGGKGIKHHYVPQAVGTAVVVGDRATGLMWQKGGSEHEMTRLETALYIDKLKATKYAGFADWRMPTLEEAMSLMEPQASNKCHIDLSFQRPPFFIWTADQGPGGKGIVIYFCNGTLAGEAEAFNASVRAVRRF